MAGTLRRWHIMPGGAFHAAGQAVCRTVVFFEKVYVHVQCYVFVLGLGTSEERRSIVAI